MSDSSLIRLLAPDEIGRQIYVGLLRDKIGAVVAAFVPDVANGYRFEVQLVGEP